MSPDAFEKTTVLPAPLERVWHAVSDAQQLGTWFGAEFDGPFEAGRRLRAKIVPTRVDPEVAKMQEPFAGTPFEFVVDVVEPMRRIVFRWHPCAVDPASVAEEPMTMLTFTFEEADRGTRLTIVESGFSRVAEGRRAEAFAAESGGWDHQLRLIRKFVDVPA